jgi:hypothetical protein
MSTRAQGTWRRGLVRAATALVALACAFAPARAEAQGNCNYSGFGGNCVIGDNATYAINLTITRAVRLALSASSIALNAPMPDDYDAGFGQTAGPVLTVKANSTWSLSIRVTQATWTASPAPARANKPAAELRWGTSAAGPFTNFTTTAVTMQSGAASAGTIIPLHFRVAYAWLLDTPGNYSLPVQITLTSP